MSLRKKLLKLLGFMSPQRPQTAPPAAEEPAGAAERPESASPVAETEAENPARESAAPLNVPAAAPEAEEPDEEADFASHMGEIVPLILEMAEPPAPAAPTGPEKTAVPVEPQSEEHAPEQAEQPSQSAPAPDERPEQPQDGSVAPAVAPKVQPTAEEAPAERPHEAPSLPAAAPQPRALPQEQPPRIELPAFKQKRVVVSLLKGGVGKTTITCFLATAIQSILDEAGADGRILVVDTDPQGSATDFFLEGTPVSPERSLRALFPSYSFPGPELIRRTRYSRIDLIAAHPSVADVAASADGGLEEYLAWYLENSAGAYSLILIDTPPSDTLALRNALMASSGIFMPLDPSRQSLRTFIQFSQTVKRYKSRNSALQIYGVIFSRYDKRQTLDRNIRESIGAQLSGTGLKMYEVPRRAAIADGYNNYTGFEALDVNKESDAVRTFRDLALQVLAR